jgi:hypothetical protein
MLALVAASQGQNPILVVIVIATVVVAVFWRAILKVGIAALVIGFMFLLVSGALDVLHVLHALIP